jgi:CRP-like cAMP-binding protein
MRLEKYGKTLAGSPLFAGVKTDDIEAMMSCLNAGVSRYRRKQYVMRAGDRPDRIGVLLSGRLRIERDDADGGRAVIGVCRPGEAFAEALCCAGVAESPVSVVCEEPAEILWMRFARILGTCSNACPFHTKLIENMVALIARRNLQLQARMELLGQKTIRDKVLRYLASLGPAGTAVTVPFDREGMADFLGAERSALSHELSRMKNDGLIDYRKSRFRIL